MQLTQSHIEELYKFTRKHYVYHYDVQTELVDHLANDIESIWVAQPQLSFDDARDASFKKFGIFGFMDVVESRQKAMNKRYWKIILRFAKEWFTVPKIVVTSAIFLTFYLALSLPFSIYVLMAAILGLAIHEMIKTAITRRKHKIKVKKKENIFLLEAMIGETRSTFTLITFVNLFNIINLTQIDFNTLNNYWLLFIAALATFFAITSYITSIIIPQKAEELLRETYPEYKIS
ncbi:hypothetical protein [Polaribacter butkevichii]|uniref:Uncharacterized protein n=1 Tax=Polaribacter butkevichii TaxID=218490 RepID=A0A2P6C7K2_9FLAO|nr:hypothetical protein [Polaribacter butkevichii]PQJ68901.1 hypothetical protein BTO14_12710 [Polaribacter butkevichii]